MKKILFILCCVILSLSLVACGTNAGSGTSGSNDDIGTFSKPTSSNDNGETSTAGMPTSSNGGAENSATMPTSSTGSGENSTSTPSGGGDDKPTINYASVTLDGDFSNADFSGCTIKAYKNDLYSLKKDSIAVTYTFKEAKFENGKTVVTFETPKAIVNGYYEEFNIGRQSQTDRDNYIKWAKNIMTWQLASGGWDKDLNGHSNNPFTGTKEIEKITHGWSKDGVPLGTIDNDGTYSEMRILAEAYQYETDQTVKASFKASFLKGMDFLTKLQTEKGGFTQVYPKRGNYSDYVTYNDNAMASVLKMLNDIKMKKFPFVGDFIDKATYDKAVDMLNKGIDYTIKAQIMSNGVYAGWCSQHDPSTYEPKKGRDFEPVSISSSESVGVIKVLLSQQDNKLAVERAEKAIEYFKKVALHDTGFDNKTAPYFFEKQGSTIWYRFYEINTDKGVFGDRDKSVHYDISEISQERREGYSWAKDYVSKLISVYESEGFFDGTYLVINQDINGNGASLKAGQKVRFN